MTTLLEQAEGMATRLQGWCNDLNDLAREAQMGDVTEAEAARHAMPVFEKVLDTALEMGDEVGLSMLDQFRARLVPSVLRAWDPWIKQAWDAPERPACHWIIAPHPDFPVPEVPFPA